MRTRSFVPAVLVLAAAAGTARAQAPVNVTQAGAGAAAVYNVVWGPDPFCVGCGMFDVILGDLNLLRAGGGAFAPTVLGCEINNAVAAPFTPVVPLPGPGAAFYVLVRAQPPPPPPVVCGTWDMEFPGAAQPVSRNPGIAASPFTCACP